MQNRLKGLDFFTIEILNTPHINNSIAEKRKYSNKMHKIDIITIFLYNNKWGF